MLLRMWAGGFLRGCLSSRVNSVLSFLISLNYPYQGRAVSLESSDEPSKPLPTLLSSQKRKQKDRNTLKLKNPPTVTDDISYHPQP